VRKRCAAASSSLFGKLRGCDSEALLQAVRYLGGWGSAIALRCCKQFAVWEVGGSAIAKRCCKQFAFGKLRECDSEARPRNRYNI